jgi:hypothetical protein
VKLTNLSPKNSVLSRGYNKPKLVFKFNGSRGLVEISTLGTFDCYLKKFDEHISIEKPKVIAKNIIFGGMYVDFSGTITSRNHKTGEKAELNFYEAKGNNNSFLIGQGFDKDGRVTREIEGSWLNEIKMINKLTGRSRILWKEFDLLPEAHL